tara:strand:+ start:382 stop:510 length:129 start_codon:yes stop_codon:yes gene_type:complete
MYEPVNKTKSQNKPVTNPTNTALDVFDSGICDKTIKSNIIFG